MKPLNTLEPSLCPTNCLFSCIVINQSYPFHFYCATADAVMSKGLTLKGVAHARGFRSGFMRREWPLRCRSNLWTLMPMSPNYSQVQW